MENRFEIFSYSKIRIALIMLLSIVLMLFFTIVGGHIFGEIGEYTGGCLGILFCFVNWFITPKYFAKSIVEIYCDNTGLEITCVKPIYGSKISKIISIKYDDFKSYKFEATSNFSTLKITVKNSAKYKVHRWYNDSGDQFDNFFTVFDKNIKIYNKKKSLLERIEKEKSIIENHSFLILVASILFLVFLAAILLLFTRPIQNISGIFLIFIFLAPLTWTSFQVIKGLKK